MNILIVAGTLLLFGAMIWDRAKKLKEQKEREEEARQSARSMGYSFAGYRR